MMKYTIVLLLASLIILGAVGGSVLAADDTQTSSERLIHTSATGEVLTSPDRVEVSFAVETESADARTAENSNAGLMSAVISALEAKGLTSTDFKTTGYSIYPVYESSTGILKPSIRTYRVTNTLLVTLKDITRAGEIIDSAVGAGANRVNYINFKVSDEKQDALRSHVLQDAVQRTRLDAQAVANASGLVITGVKEITVGSYYPPPVVDYLSVRAEAGTATTPIEPGEVRVTAQVSVTYLCA